MYVGVDFSVLPWSPWRRSLPPIFSPVISWSACAKAWGTQLHLNSLHKKEVEHETAGQTGSSWKASWKY